MWYYESGDSNACLAVPMPVGQLSLLTGRMFQAAFVGDLGVGLVGVGFAEVAMAVEAHGVLDEDSTPANSVGR